jgi:hypothetical protein
VNKPFEEEEDGGSREIVEQLDRAFTNADRKRVEEVLADVLEELADTHTLRGMFAPYGEIVVTCLTDERITQNRADREADLKEEIAKQGKHARQVAREFGNPFGHTKSEPNTVALGHEDREVENREDF